MENRFLAIGGAHWDILGRAPSPMNLHDDVGGRIRRIIGGVAGPIAMKLGKLGANVSLICYAGRDDLGEALLAKLAEFHVQTKHALRGDLPTDVYMGIEAPNGLIAAIADCHSLEARSDEATSALAAHSDAESHVILDGNIREDALAKIARTELRAKSLTLVPASPGKIARFRPFIHQTPAQLIVNKREAELLASQQFTHSAEAAAHLCAMGFVAALVSDGPRPASFSTLGETVSALPPEVEVKRYTGAGDTLAAHFLFAQSRGDAPLAALQYALQATSEFISNEDMDA